MTPKAPHTPTDLDHAIRLFKGYVKGENGFDELDFKEYIIDVYTNGQIAAVLDRLTAEMNLFTAGHDAPMRDEALEAIQAERDKLKESK